MANKIPGKGSSLYLSISSVDTVVANIIDIDIGAQEPMVVDTPVLDQTPAGIPRDATGFTAQGPITANIYADPDDATFKFIATNSQTPGTKVTGFVAWPASVTAADVTFTAAAIGLGAAQIRHNDVIKASINIAVDGLAEYATA